MENNDQEKFGLVTNIKLESFSQNSNENNQEKNYTVFSEFDDYYLIFTDNKHNKLGILKNQSSIKEGEEIIFYTRKMPKHIEIIKYFDCGINCEEEDQLCKVINNLDNYLWKVLPNPPKEKKSEQSDQNKDEYKNYLHHLKADDIINFGNNKIILREIHFSEEEKGNKKNKLTKRKYTMLYESIYDKKCDVCNSNSNSGDSHVIKICKCEKYYHKNCLKESMETMVEKKDGIGFSIFEIKTICNECKNFIHFNFIIKKGNTYEYFELIDIPRNIDENYLIFETLDFETNKEQNAKYIYFIKLTKKDNNDDNDNEDILILKEPQKNDVITFYNKIEKKRIEKEEKEKKEKQKKEGEKENKKEEEEKEEKEKQEKINLDDSNILASIEYDIKKKSLVLKRKNDNQNIKVLSNKYIIEKKVKDDKSSDKSPDKSSDKSPDKSSDKPYDKSSDKPYDKLKLESKFMKVEAEIISEEKFEETKKKMGKNPDKIEEREDN